MIEHFLWAVFYTLSVKFLLNALSKWEGHRPAKLVDGYARLVFGVMLLWCLASAAMHWVRLFALSVGA